MTKPIEQHAMQLEQTHPSGAEEWCCPSCGRRIMLNWTPFEMMVINQGDALAQHSGGKGGLEMVAASPQASSEDTWPELVSSSRILS